MTYNYYVTSCCDDVADKLAMRNPDYIIIEKYNTLTPINIVDSNFNRQVKGNIKLRQVSFKYIYSNQIRTQQQ
jgi:hypothetical protein